MSAVPEPGADHEAVAAANEAFYAAVEAGDLDALRASLVPGPQAVCVHPGAAPIHGLDQVLRSWALVMASNDYIQFFLTDVKVSVDGDLAAVTCRENVLTGADAVPHGFAGGLAEAVNVFRRTDGGWRLWLHQAAPVVSEAG